MTVNYNLLNAHERDSLLIFDEIEHIYTYQGCQFKSVTTLVEEQFPRFDSVTAAARVAMRQGWDPADVLEEWNRIAGQARNLGTRMHDLIERHYLGELIDDDTDAFRLFRRFALDRHLYPYRSEWRIYHEDYRVAGTLDFLELTPDGTYNIWDWKRSHKLIDDHGNVIRDSRFGSRGLGRMRHLPDVSFWHYALQVSIYRFILKEKYGIEVRGMHLGVFHPDYDRPYVIDLPYLYDEVRAVLSVG